MSLLFWKGDNDVLQLHNAKHFMFDGEEREDWRIVNTTNDISFQTGRTKSIQTENGASQPIFKLYFVARG